jgi:2-polyprenyl-6-methoxyphenol hydroxylase-like FAD-dependent oxidoreductase
MLACELDRCGVQPVVLERRRERDDRLRGENIMRPSAQVLDRHGLLDRLGNGREELPAGRLPAVMPARQQVVEQVLEEHLTGRGVDVRRGRDITGVTQDGDTVTVEVRDGEGAASALRTRYVVGCDGARSTVRTLAGFATTGTAPTMTLYQALVTVSEPYPPPEQLPNYYRAESGIVLWAPGPSRLIVLDFTGPASNDAAPVTIEEIQERVREITGTELTVENPQSLGRFTDTTRQARTYRMGRVLLAGDAAHHHPPTGGGQGLNIALGDAANLGWKLAATMQGWAPPGLLDTYDAERRPVGARAIRNSRAEMLLLKPDKRMVPAYELYTEIWHDQRIRPHLIDLVSMGRLAYDMGVPAKQAHPLLGHAASDLPVETAGGTGRVSKLLRGGRGLVIDLVGLGHLHREATQWADRVDIVTASSLEEDAIDALLVRPDGHVAWVWPSDGPPQPGPLRESLRRWFGNPQGNTRSVAA